MLDWSLVSYLDQVIDGPFLDENTDTTWTLTTNVTTGSGIMVASQATFNAQHIGALWRKTDYIQGGNVILTATDLLAYLVQYLFLLHGY